MITQTATGSFLFPFFAITIALKAYFLTFLNVTAQYFKNSIFFLLAPFYKRINGFLEVGELLGYNGAQYHCRLATVGFRAHCTELELVTRKGERRGAIAVGSVEEEVGYFAYYIQFEVGFFLRR